MALLEFTKKGIYCPPAKIYIDPWKAVERALITHGHADHSRWGHRAYLCTAKAKPVIRYRLGHVNIQTVEYNEPITINGVKFSFHPAGHIIGSAQIRVEHKGEIWVASGDYKIEDDGLSEAFEPVKCHTFITESTFGLPVYRWPTQDIIFNQINEWWASNKAEGKVSLITAYALGKAQRLLSGLDLNIGKIYTHGAIENTNKVIRKQGIALPETHKVNNQMSTKDFIGQMVIAPPSALNTPWIQKIKPLSVGIASGWMAVRGMRQRRAADRGFLLSDHADWDGLNQAVENTEAENVIVTHGYSDIFARWLRENKGINAVSAQTEFEGESLDATDEKEISSS